MRTSEYHLIIINNRHCPGPACARKYLNLMDANQFILAKQQFLAVDAFLSVGQNAKNKWSLRDSIRLESVRERERGVSFGILNPYTNWIIIQMSQ